MGKSLSVSMKMVQLLPWILGEFRAEFSVQCFPIGISCLVMIKLLCNQLLVGMKSRLEGGGGR